MADLRYKVVVDDEEAKRRISELLKGSGVSGSGFSDSSSDKKASSSINEVRDAQVKLKEAQLANINAIRQQREEMQRQRKELADLNLAFTQGKINAQEYALSQKKITAEQKEQARQAKELKKQLSDNSEYAKLAKALNNVRKETKDVLAEMFSLERRGYGAGAGFEALKKKSEALTKQTQYLDKAIKKIDATVGQHQRNVGNYADALGNMVPIIGNVNSQLAAFGTSLDDLANKPGAIKELGLTFAGMGKSILTFLVSPIGAAITAIAGLFMLFKANKDTVIDFNSGLLNVGKTTGLSGQALQDFSDDIIKLSRALQTVSTDKLLEYASVAGQLGVKGSQNILAFTEALAKLETASDISGEEGGSEIARLLTLADGGVQNVKAFGDEIVNLGNNFAATESEILGNATKIAQSTGIYKVGRQEILAFATATKSVGVEAELVGSTMGRTLGTLEKAIRTGNGLSTVLKLVGGTQAELSKRFRNDASGVLIDFIGGLNRTGKSASDFNKSLEEVGITATRDTAVIGSLASNGFKILTDALGSVKNATGAMDAEFTTASEKLSNQAARIGIAWDNMILGIDNGQGTIGKSSVAVIRFIADTIDTMSGSVSTTDRLVSSYERFESQTNKLDRALAPLIERYDELKSKSTLNKVEQDELKTTIQRLADLIPTAVTGFNQYGDAIDINRGKIISFNNAQKQLLKDMNLSTVKTLNVDLDELKRQKDQLVKAQNASVSGGKETFFSKVFSIGLSEEDKAKGIVDRTERLAKTTDKILQNLRKTKNLGGALSIQDEKFLKKYDEVPSVDPKGNGDAGITESLKKNKSYWEGIVSETQSTIDNLETGQRGTKTWTDLTKKLVEAQKNVDKYSLSKDESAGKSANKSAENARQATERQRSLQMSFDQNHEQLLRNKLSRDEQEVASIQDKYKKMTEEARKFNDDPKNKGKRVDTSNFKSDEKFEISEANTKIDTRYIIDNLNQQKALYDQFEAYKLQVGEEKAKERFQNEIDLSKTFGQVAEKERYDLLDTDPTKMTAAQKERLVILDKIIADHDNNEKNRELAKYADAIQLSETYNDQLLKIQKKYQEAYTSLGASATEEQKAILVDRMQTDIDSLNETEAAKNKILVRGAKQYLLFTTASIVAQIKTVKNLLSNTDLSDDFRKKLEANLSGLQKSLRLGATAVNLEVLKNKVADLRIELIRLSNIKGANPEEIKKINTELVQTQEEIDNLTNEKLRSLFDFLQKIAQSLNQLGESFSNLGEAFDNNTLSAVGDTLSGLASNIDGLSVAFDKTATKSDKYAAAAQALVNIVSMVANASAERKRAEEEYYRSVIQLQQDYNLSLNERLRLESQLGESVYVKDYVGRVQDGIEAANDAMVNYQKALSDLTEKGQAKTGQRNAVDWGNVGKGAASGVTFGAAIGSVVPVIGTAIGAVVGGIVGAIVGLFSKKKKDTFTSILKEYPELIKKSSDGMLDIDKSLAEQLIKNNLVNDETKQILQNVIEWADALEAARAQIREVVTELSGALGDDLRNGLVDAFKAGENAAIAMGKSVSKILEDMLTQLLFAKAFDGLFKTLENQLTDALAFGNEADVIDAFSNFLAGAGSAGEQFLSFMEMFQKEAKKKGIDIFSGKDSESSSGLKGSIQRELTEATASELTGLYRSTYDVMKRTLQESQTHGLTLSKQLDIANNSLTALNAISNNTANTVNRLDTAIVELQRVNKNLGGKF